MSTKKKKESKHLSFFWVEKNSPMIAVRRWGMTSISAMGHDTFECDHSCTSCPIARLPSQDYFSPQTAIWLYSFICSSCSFSFYMWCLHVCLPDKDEMTRKFAHCFVSFDLKKTFVSNMLCVLIFWKVDSPLSIIFSFHLQCRVESHHFAKLDHKNEGC